MSFLFKIPKKKIIYLKNKGHYDIKPTLFKPRSGKILTPKNEEFNPDEHEAISVVENKAVSPNTCLEVTQKGFKFKDRVIRPAMVVVSKK